VVSQTKQNEEFRKQDLLMSEASEKLPYKVDSMTTHTKMIQTQISKTSQIATSSKTSGVLTGQPKPRLKEICF